MILLNLGVGICPILCRYPLVLLSVAYGLFSFFQFFSISIAGPLLGFGISSFGELCLYNLMLQEPPTTCQSVLQSCGESAAFCPPGLAYCDGWEFHIDWQSKHKTSEDLEQLLQLHGLQQIVVAPPTGVMDCWTISMLIDSSLWISFNILEWSLHTFSFSSIQTVVYFRLVITGNRELWPQNYTDRNWDATPGNWLHSC